MFTIVALLIVAILLTLVSGCKKQTCTVTFKAVGEEDIVITTEYGKSITPPKVPEKIGNDGKWDVAYFGKITENFTVNAVYETRGLEYTPLDNGTGCEVSKGEMDENTQELFIPEQYNGARVIRIANSAFEECDNLKRAVLPDSVLYIGETAFQKCERLQHVRWPANLLEIENSAFTRVKGLREIVFPEKLSAIGNYAFMHCYQVRSVVFPNRLTIIGSGAFLNCSALQSVIFSGESRTEVGNSAFGGCSVLTSITFPSFSVEKIGSEAFIQCVNLKTVVFPTGLTEIGGRVFTDCVRLTSVTIPSTVVTIEKSLFYFHSELPFQPCTFYVQGLSERPKGWVSSWANFDSKVVWNA